MSAAEQPRPPIVRLTIEKPSRLEHVMKWVELATEGLGMPESSLVECTVTGSLVVSAFLPQTCVPAVTDG